MSPLQIQLARVRRGLWIVVAVAVIAVAATAFSMIQSGTQYTGRATLSISSQNRAPEQDTVLATGYVDYFNEAAYQQRLRETAPVPAGVTFSARLAAASPIIYVEGTGPDPEVVRSAVSTMASAFRRDVNDGIAADERGRIDALQQQIAVQQKALGDSRPNSQEGTLAAQAISELQSGITAIQADTSNQLQQLQVAAVISANRPRLAVNLGLALLGGLILGVLAALALAVLRNRLSTAAETESHLGVDVLAEIDGGCTRAAEQERQRHVERLANLVALTASSRPVVIAVVAPRHTAASATVAGALAAYRAGQRERTILVRTDLHVTASPASAIGQGVSDVLHPSSTSTAVSLLRPGGLPDLRILTPGTVDDDPYLVFRPERLEAVLDQLSGVAEFVVLDVPPLLETSEAQAICAVAGHVILVAETGVTTVPDARAALHMLGQVDRKPFGCVLVDPRVATGRGLPFLTAVEPRAVEPGTVEQGSAQPLPVQPAPLQSDPAEPQPLKPGVAEPQPLEAKPAKARPAEPQPIEPQSTAVEGEPVDLDAAEAEPVESARLEPQVAEHGPAEVPSAKNETAEPEVAELGSAEPASAEPTSAGSRSGGSTSVGSVPAAPEDERAVQPAVGR